MDIPLFISTILSSAGVFSLIQFFVSRHDQKKEDLAGIKKELNSIKNGQDGMNMRVTRMELTNLIQSDPSNLDAILQVAEYYFIDLDGNAYAHAMFEKWATEHNVAIGWLPKLRKGVSHGTKLSKN